MSRVRAEADVAEASVAEQALGVAARDRHDLAAALTHLRRSVHIAEDAGLVRRAAQARLTLAGVLALRGNMAGALRELGRAAPRLKGPDLARLQAQRGFLLQVQGRMDEALEAYRTALTGFRRAGDIENEAHLLGNRGGVHTRLWALDAAEADLVRAEELYLSLGEAREVADVRVNLGCVLARKGDVPAALSRFDQADEYFRSDGFVDPGAMSDRCEALLAARLVTEARQAAEEAIERLARGRSASLLAEARLHLSEAALLQGDVATAATEAEMARRAFARQRRPSFVALARYASVRAAWMGGDRSPALLTSARRTADALTKAGWAAHALDARLVAGRLALEIGKLGVGREELSRARQARRWGPVQLRSRAWHAEALLRLADDDRKGAETALRAGMRVLDRYRVALGATDLRAHASGHGADLATLGLRLALEAADAGRALAWAERWRAGSLQLRPVRPPPDPTLRRELAALRRVVSELEEAARQGGNTAPLLGRQAALEEAVRRRARRAPGLGLYRSHPAFDTRRTRERLGSRALVEFVELDGRLHAVVMAGTAPRLHALTTVGAVTAELERVRFALRRLAARRGSEASLAAARQALLRGAHDLDEMLLAPLHSELAGRWLVVVPTGALHAVPWSLLPSCASVPVIVAPSLASWEMASRGDGGAPQARRVVLVAGPGLPGAAAEVSELREHYPRARCLAGSDAEAASVLSELEGAELAHIAAHGRFRADNPLFSSLQLADGPLMVYDLDGLGQAPECLVLSACESGLSEVCAGDELMGLVTALLALGTRNLIASVVAVPDDATRRLMLAMHREIAAGLAPAVALVHARSTCGNDDLVAAGAFVCFGGG